MENHRLTEMKEYDPKVFNSIYKDTRILVKKLCFGIDYQRLGVTPDIVESWFDDKFIYIFNKYYGDMDNNVLKGHIISGLQLFRNRILKSAYTQKAMFNQNFIDIGEDNELNNIIAIEGESSTRETLINLVYSFIEKEISRDAYYIFQLQMDPPPYILSRISHRNSKIPNRLYAEFCNLPSNNKTFKYLSVLRKEITEAIKKAQDEFKGFSFELAN